MSGELRSLSFDMATLHAAFARGVAPAAVVAEVYRQIAAVDDPGIFIHLRPEAQCAAEASALLPFNPEAMPLWGIPFAIKDNIDLAGSPTTAACPDYAYSPDADAFAVAALKAAGAVPVGKTNLDQIATGLVGVRSPYRAPKNALDSEIVPGSSSSGSAVAVAHGIVSFALGTDTAGSGRLPAALNNIVGLKPTLGAISNTGVVPACRTLDTISVFALTVPDAWRALQGAARFDAADAFAREIAMPPLVALPPSFKVGVPDAAARKFFGDTAQAASFDNALERLASFGAEIAELNFTLFFEVAAMLYRGPWVAERLSVVEGLMRDAPAAIHPITRRIVGDGARFSAVDTFRAIYRLAELKRKVAPLLAEVDLLCVPTGPRTDGRPGSVTIIAPAGRDSLAAALAERLQRDAAPRLGATANPLPSAALPPAGLLPGETALAVVGAHMSGLPLNCELTARAGRYLRNARTAPI